MEWLAEMTLLYYELIAPAPTWSRRSQKPITDLSQAFRRTDATIDAGVARIVAT